MKQSWGLPKRKKGGGPTNPIGFDEWVWLKIKQEGLRRFWSMCPLTRVPFWYWFFEPQPSHGDKTMSVFVSLFFFWFPVIPVGFLKLAELCEDATMPGERSP